MQDLLEGYQLPSWPKTQLDRDLWNAVMADINARLKARELLEASFELLQQEGVQAALDYIQVSVAPQLSDLQAAIGRAQAAIDEILGGNAPNAQKLGGQPPAYYATAQALADGLATKANSVEITALIEQRVAALVDSSPAALDTLKELATALGNDPNFAATMTTQLSKKFDKAGGNLSGALSIVGNDLALRLNAPTFRSWYFQVLNNGRLRIVDETGGTEVFSIGPDGSVTTSQLGDLNSRIEARAAAYADDRSNHGFRYQTWQDVKAARAGNTNYQNTTGRPIMVSITVADGQTGNIVVNGVVASNVRSNNARSPAQIIVPNGQSYSCTCTAYDTWAELR